MSSIFCFLIKSGLCYIGDIISFLFVCIIVVDFTRRQSQVTFRRIVCYC